MNVTNLAEIFQIIIGELMNLGFIELNLRTVR